VCYLIDVVGSNFSRFVARPIRLNHSSHLLAFTLGRLYSKTPSSPRSNRSLLSIGNGAPVRWDVCRASRTTRRRIEIYRYLPIMNRRPLRRWVLTSHSGEPQAIIYVSLIRNTSALTVLSGPASVQGQGSSVDTEVTSRATLFHAHNDHIIAKGCPRSGGLQTEYLMKCMCQIA